MVEKAVQTAERPAAGPGPGLKKRQGNQAAAGEFSMHLRCAAHKPAKGEPTEKNAAKRQCEAEGVQGVPVLYVLEGAAAPELKGGSAPANTPAKGAPAVRAAAQAADIVPAFTASQDAGPAPAAAPQGAYRAGVTAPPAKPEPAPVEASLAGVLPFAARDGQASAAAFAADFAGEQQPGMAESAPARPQGGPDVGAFGLRDKAAAPGESAVYNIAEPADASARPEAERRDSAGETVLAARQGYADKPDAPVGPPRRISAAASGDSAGAAGEKATALEDKADDMHGAAQKNAVPVKAAAPFKVYSGRENAITEAIKGESAVFQVAESILQKGPVRKTSFAIELSPKELGRVTVKMDCIGGKLTLKLSAENVGTSKLLAENVEQLRSALADRRVDVASIDIDAGYTPPSFADFSGNFGQAQREKGAGPGRRARVYRAENDGQKPGFENTGALIYSESRLLNYIV